MKHSYPLVYQKNASLAENLKSYNWEQATFIETYFE